LELVGDEAVSTGWERLNGRHGEASVEIGSAPSIARHLAFVIPAGDRERVGRCSPGAQYAWAMPLLGGLALLRPFQLARGCLEGVIQPRVLSKS